MGIMVYIFVRAKDAVQKNARRWKIRRPVFDEGASNRRRGTS